MGDDTERHQRKSPRISEDTVVLFKVGTLVSCVAAIALGSVWVYQIKLNSEQALADVRALRSDLAPILDQHRRLWWDYELRTAGRGTSSQAGP